MFPSFHTTVAPSFGAPETVHLDAGGSWSSVCFVASGSTLASKGFLDFLKKIGQSQTKPTILDTGYQQVDDEIHQKLCSLAKVISLQSVYPATKDYLSVVSLSTYHWLRNQKFDLVIFAGGIGCGYFSTVAKYLDLDFSSTVLLALPFDLHGHSLQTCQAFPKGYDDFECDYLERETIRRSDALLCPSTEILDCMAARAWILPHLTATFGSGDTPFSIWLAPAFRSQPKISQSNITISVCMACRNRPHFLKQALTSLLQQTDQDFEVILIDDGSDIADMNTLKNAFDTLFKERGWRWIRQNHGGASEARNHAARIAQGSHLLFMDDDNIAYTDEIECMRRAAQSGTDILTCALGIHPDGIMGFEPLLQLPGRDHKTTRPLGWLPLGNALELAPFLNRMGETNSLFKKDVFYSLGGFQGGASAIFEDFNLLIKASLAGYTLETVPEILMLYRRHAQSMSMGETIFQSHLTNLENFTQLIPAFLRPILLYARHGWYDRHQMRSRRE